MSKLDRNKWNWNPYGFSRPPHLRSSLVAPNSSINLLSLYNQIKTWKHLDEIQLIEINGQVLWSKSSISN